MTFDSRCLAISSSPWWSLDINTNDRTWYRTTSVLATWVLAPSAAT